MPEVCGDSPVMSELSGERTCSEDGEHTESEGTAELQIIASNPRWWPGVPQAACMVKSEKLHTPVKKEIKSAETLKRGLDLETPPPPTSKSRRVVPAIGQVRG